MGKLKGILLSMLLLSSTVLADEWVYTVRPGDNLWSLTEKYMLSMRYWLPLLKLNQIDQPKRMPPGTRLRMPLQWSKISRVGALVVDVKGSVEIENLRNGTRRPVRVGEKLQAAHRLITDSASSLLLEFGDSSRLLLTGDTNLDLEQLHGYGDGDVTDTRLRMERGGSESLVNPEKKSGTRFEITTPSALTAVRGTGFRLSSDATGQSSKVEVTSGRVQVVGSGRKLNVANGFGVIARQGQAALKPVKLLAAPSLEGVPSLVEDVAVRFRLQALSGARGYRAQVTERGNLGTLELDLRFVDEQIQLDLADLPDGEYQLRLRGVDAEGIEGRDAVHAFQLNARPAPPFQISPPAGSEFIETRPTFEWARPDGASGYRFQLSRTQEMDDVVLAPSVLAAERFVPAMDLTPGLYFWRVSALDEMGDMGPVGYPQQFRILPKAPHTEPPVLDDTGLTFHWRPGSPGQQFQFQLARDPAFEQMVEDLRTDEAKYFLDGPQPGTYYMRIKTIDSDGSAGPFGRTQSIEVKGPPDLGWVVLIPAAIMLLLAL